MPFARPGAASYIRSMHPAMVLRRNDSTQS